MLADLALEHALFNASPVVLSPGSKDIARHLKAATRYVLNRDAVQVVSSILFRRPSSIAKIIPQLHFVGPVWLEYACADEDASRAALGLPPMDKRPEDDLKRIGWLAVPEDAAGRVLRISSVIQHRHHHDRCVPTVFQIRLHLDGAPATPYAPGDSAPALAGLPDEMVRNGRWARQTAWGEHERAGAKRIVECVQPITEGLAGMALMRADERLASDVRRTLLHLIDGVLPLIATFGLLQSRNAVVMERVDTSRISKARERSGRPPLLDHIVVKISLTEPKRVYRAAGEDDRDDSGGGVVTSRAAAFVDAHYKVRSTGIFLWRGHPRRGIGAPRSKTVILTR